MKYEAVVIYFQLIGYMLAALNSNWNDDRFNLNGNYDDNNRNGYASRMTLG